MVHLTAAPIIVLFLLLTLSIVYESVLKSQPSEYFEKNNIFYQRQFGFPNKKSTTFVPASLNTFFNGPKTLVARILPTMIYTECDK